MNTWSDVTTAPNGAVLKWAREQSWAEAMAQCSQDAQWHAEGDVWTHTCMVCAQLERLPEWRALDRSQQLALLFTALFHDAGKPATTIIDPETGRTRSPHHASVGVSIARGVLRELACPFELRELICSLVASHGRPPYILAKPSPENEVIRHSWLTNNRLLYLFTLADTRGRKAVETTRSEEPLHLWKLVAEEQACFESPYCFANEHARFLFFRNQLSHVTYAPYEKFRCTVTLMSGSPGAGKDAWLKANRPQLPVVSLDEIRAEIDVDPADNQGEVIQAARERCREYLRSGTDFALNATNVTSLVRKRWIDLAADYEARVEVVYLEPELETILSQNRQRTARVPERVILSLLEKLEPPTITECHSLTFGRRD
jgi:putative nucleotidyltransferase with HDIG domain